MKHTVRGSEYLADFTNFKLKGRDADLERISSILMRKTSNSLLLVGPAGVGTSALMLGLQASKNDPEAPFDIVSKRLFWLDTDSLFASGDGAEINSDFQKILRQLEATPESVLIIENTFNFIEAARNTGNPHFINALNLLVRKDKTQVILEVRDEQLTQVLKWHSDVAEAYTLYDVQEPVGAILQEIVYEVSIGLADFHKVQIDDSAVLEAIRLTSKYRDSLGLGGAQPARAISLLDRALSSYRQQAHRKHPILVKLELDIQNETDKSKVLELQSKHLQLTKDWDALQTEIRKTYKSQRDGEELLFKLHDDLEAARKKKHPEPEVTVAAQSFAQLAGSGLESPEAAKINTNIRAIEAEVAANRERHNELVLIANRDLLLDSRAVVTEFSKISGIAADKLDANEMENLRNLEANLLSRIYGQDDAVKHIANSIKVAKVDDLNEAGPAASYLLLGPSGVGKTEIAKALAQYVGGDESALERFDMSEYMEKHAAAKLIGAPPGYEGFEAGGILTNKVRKKPVGIYLFDEIEKAHPDVFNIFLQILSDGRLTDNIGRTVDFSEVIIIMTSNIGQPYYLDVNLTDEQAQAYATDELNKTYRSELLNRFNGRENILHFKRLGIENIQKIIKREITKLNKSYEKRGLVINISDASIKAFCECHYDPTRGARGLPGYIKANLRPVIVNHILENPEQVGVFEVEFNSETKNFVVDFKS